MLNKEQLKAVKTTEGAMLVLAGAGSGKTKVLTERVSYLINEKQVDPRNILAITFTNKAAKEMKERIYNLVNDNAKNIQISTFHSFGLKILKVYAKKVGLDSNFTILDANESLDLIKQIIKENNLDVDYKLAKNIISTNKNNLISKDSYNDDEDIQLVYEIYEERLKQTNTVDFDDLLMLPIVLFKTNPSILEYYQNLYKYILVDEYQDTNEAQYILTKMISAKYKNICVVGDDSQSIYSWRGSNYQNILNFEKDYPNCKVIYLEQNYRSTKTIIESSNNVIKNNKNRKDKTLWTDNEVGSKINYSKVFDEKEEALFVANKINDLISDGYDYKDIVVLYRTNAQSRNFEEQFIVDSIPYKVIGSTNFYSRKEIKDILGYLKLIYNPKDNQALLRVINTPKRKIGKSTIDKLKEKAKLSKKSLYEVIDSGRELEFKKLIETFILEKDNILLSELVNNIINRANLTIDLEEDRVLNLEEFKSICFQFQEKHGIITLEDFLNEVSLLTDLENLDDSLNTVTLMTIHLSKGLEFNYVFIVGLEESVFPHFNSFNSSEQLEEERRLMYVAMTRARLGLYLTSTNSRLLYGNRSHNKESRFIKEIDKEHFKIARTTKTLINEDIDYILGEKIMFDLYGIGVIVGIDKDILTVAFENKHGIKKLIKGHKKIKKV